VEKSLNGALAHCGGDCRITLLTCNDDDDRTEATRQVIANNTGCTVCGTYMFVVPGWVHSLRPAKEPGYGIPTARIPLDCQEPGVAPKVDPEVVPPGVGPRPTAAPFTNE